MPIINMWMQNYEINQNEQQIKYLFLNDYDNYNLCSCMIHVLLNRGID